MKPKYLLFSVLSYLLYGNFAVADDLPANPWGNVAITSPVEENSETISEIKPEEEQEVINQNVKQTTKTLPQNPWSSKNTTNSAPLGQKINPKTSARQIATTGTQNGPQTQPAIRRNSGGVGRIGYVYKPKTQSSSTYNNDTSTMFDGLFEDTPDMVDMPSIPKANSTDMGFDFSYDTIKRKSVNKFHQFTAPITNTVQKWINAVKQTGEDLMK